MPISLLNTDVKRIYKVLAKWIKKLLSSLVSLNQTAYLENRFRRKGGRLSYDISEVTIKSFLLTADFGKAFDSANHLLAFPCVRKTWIWEKK